MYEPCWRCADTITALYLHTLPHGSVAPDSLTAGLRCAALWLSGNHSTHPHDVYSKTEHVRWPRKHTHAQKVSQSHEKEVGGTGRGCARDHRTSGWCDRSLSRRGKRGEQGSGVKIMLWPVRFSCSAEVTQERRSQSETLAHTGPPQRARSRSATMTAEARMCLLFQLTRNNQHQIMFWLIPRNEETLCFSLWSKNVSKLQQNYVANQRFSAVKRNNESDHWVIDATLQLRFNVVWFYKMTNLMLLMAACSFTSEKAGYEPTFGGVHLCFIIKPEELWSSKLLIVWPQETSSNSQFMSTKTDISSIWLKSSSLFFPQTSSHHRGEKTGKWCS